LEKAKIQAADPKTQWVSQDDLYYIELAEKELTSGESFDWSEIKWK
jgi:hypothetical protein